jgi:catalase
MPDDIDTTLGESYYNDSKALEDKRIDDIVEMTRRAIEGHFRQGKGPARRDAHAFDNGCVRAVFRVDPKLPPDLQHGVFIPAREYKAWIRFSNGNSEPRPQWWPDARGMAIKLTGVEGAKLIDDEQQTQDFILISHPVFFVDDLERYKVTLEAFLRGGIIDQYVWALSKLRWREARLAAAANLRVITNPLLQQYWSMTPYRLGADAGQRTAVKYMAKPHVAEKITLLRRFATCFGRNFSLKEELNDTLAGGERRFDFYVQRSAGDQRTPIENSTIEWTEDIAPPEHVGEIIIPPQDIMSAEQARFCENLSFSPWHALPAHKPLGVVNRVRKVAYLEISRLRHTLNAAPRQEPTGDEVFE